MGAWTEDQSGYSGRMIWIPLAAATAIQADLHLDTPTQLHRQDAPLDAPTGLEGGLDQLRAGGTNLAVQVLWPPRNAEWRRHTFGLLERLEAEVERLDDLSLVRTPAQARQVAEDGGIGVMVALEGAHGLGEDWRWDLYALQQRGLGMVGLTWSLSNRFAGSSADDGGGLTNEGRALVATAQRAGLMIDVSHASRQTTLDVCAMSQAPVIASHSGARAIYDHPRNLGDDELKCIAATGGVVGLNLHGPFLGGERDIEAAAKHLEHIRSVAGLEAVALGSDYDGIIQPAQGLPHAGALPTLWEALTARGWEDDEVEALRGENFMRAWAAALD